MPKTKYATDWSQVPLIVDIAYASVLLGVNPETLRRSLAKGEIKGKKYGKGWIMLKEDLMEFVGAK